MVTEQMNKGILGTRNVYVNKMEASIKHDFPLAWRKRALSGAFFFWLDTYTNLNYVTEIIWICEAFPV